MDVKEELFERFGKQLIEQVRDNQIHFIYAFLEQKAPLSSEYKIELEGLSAAQMQMLKEMAVQLVDGALHDLLYLFEGTTWIKLQLESEQIKIDDIRQVTTGDLQGYIFIWGEKYSKETPSSYKE